MTYKNEQFPVDKRKQNSIPDSQRRQGPGDQGSAYQAEEFVDHYDPDPTVPGDKPKDNSRLVRSSSPGQSFHSQPTKSPSGEK